MGISQTYRWSELEGTLMINRSSLLIRIRKLRPSQVPTCSRSYKQQQWSPDWKPGFCIPSSTSHCKIPSENTPSGSLKVWLRCMICDSFWAENSLGRHQTRPGKSFTTWSSLRMGYIFSYLNCRAHSWGRGLWHWVRAQQELVDCEWCRSKCICLRRAFHPGQCWGVTTVWD